jgi:hypothetical protein
MLHFMVLPFGALEQTMRVFPQSGLSAGASPASGVPQRFDLLTITVASKDALLARRALLVCASTSILRCLPMHREDRVKLEIRFPAGQSDAVISRIMACLPNGEIGAIIRCGAPVHQGSRAGSNVVHLPAR